MRKPIAVLAALLIFSTFTAAQQPAARRADAVAERFFSSDWSKADPAAAPAPSAPAAEPVERAESVLPDEGPIQDDHAKVTHMSITRVAYLYYLSRYDGGELSRYIGESNGQIPASDTPDNVVSGSFDEDGSHNDPWNQLIPEMRHFWDCRKGPFKGLWGYDSSVNRAQKYFTGGYGLKGAYDKGWEKKEKKGHGIVWHYKNGDKALAYWYLGHAAHLLEDATVPAHVLLYPHPFKNVDRYETYMGTHYPDWEKKIPEGDVDSFATLYDLFYHTANTTNDFDAGSGSGLAGRDGKKDRGSRRKGGFTDEELRQEGDVLMPLAYRSVASIFLYFFQQIDQTPPRVTLVYPASKDAGTPDLTADSRATLSARAVDDVSGVDRYGYRFEYAVWTGKAWSAWRPASTGPTVSSLDFAVEPGRRYEVRVSAVDAAGNRAYSEPGYLSAVPAPAVASLR